MGEHSRTATPRKAHALIAVVHDGPSHLRVIQDHVFDREYVQNTYRSHDGSLEIAFSLRTGDLSEDQFMNVAQNATPLILGNDSEWSDSLGETCMANGAFIEFDTSNNYLRILTSIVGLPALFIYRDVTKTIIASDLYLLTRVREVSLHLSVDSIGQLCRIGQPVSGRTLFKEVEVAPAGSSLIFRTGTQVQESPGWNFETKEEAPDWASYTELQIGALKRAVRAIDTSRSFMSLTSGLDTRAIMALLVADKRSLPAYTLTGKIRTLDATIAANLCNEYDFAHSGVFLTDSFHKNLPEYVMEASRLSGGLASLDEAHEIYFYHCIERNRNARLSGNLGNQVGRRGVERISMRDAGLSILSHSLRRTAKEVGNRYANVKANNGAPDFTFLLKSEIPSSSVGNYCIGNYHAVQQTPYANCNVIKNVAYMPNSLKKSSKLSHHELRFRDLKHRFIGQTAKESFQVKLIREIGGYVASCPINWGWRADGGVSLKGVGNGCLAFIDAVTSPHVAHPSIVKKLLDKAGITGMHEYRNTDLWVKSHLKEFVYDTLSTCTTHNSGLFNTNDLMGMLEKHYSDKENRTKDITLALDLALIPVIFKVGL